MGHPSQKAPHFSSAPGKPMPRRMAVVLFVVVLATVNCLMIAASMRRRARSLATAPVLGDSPTVVREPRSGQQMTLLVAALLRVTVRVLLVLACGLGVASVIFALWAVPHAGTQPPAPAVVLFFGLLPLFGISLLANTVITMGEIPKNQRDPLSMNAALYRRFARRSSRRVKVTLATALALAVPLAATGVLAEAPTGLFGGASLAFYVVTVGMLIALLPAPHPDADETGPSETPRQRLSAP